MGPALTPDLIDPRLLELRLLRHRPLLHSKRLPPHVAVEDPTFLLLR